MLNEHRCELIKSSELSLSDRKTSATKTFFYTWITINEVHPLCKEYLISLSTLNKEKQRHEVLKSWWIIHPFSKIRYFGIH